MFFAYVWVCFCILISLSCQEVEPAQGKHIEGRCVNSSCSTLPSSEESFCHRECVVISKCYFFVPRGTFHTIENNAIYLKVIRTVRTLKTRMAHIIRAPHLLDVHRNHFALSELKLWYLWLFSDSKTQVRWCWSECISVACQLSHCMRKRGIFTALLKAYNKQTNLRK